MVSSNTEVAIVGAGPYGLAVAAYLKYLRIPFRIFGSPMQFWRDMPPEMYLKSSASATNICTPENFITLNQYLSERGLDPEAVCAVAEFARYGQYIQMKNISEIDNVNVNFVHRLENKFYLTTDTGEIVESNHVVIAVGLKAFSRIPGELSRIGKQFVSHSYEHSTFEPFRGKTVYVIGGGQSALQSAALLHEAGSHVEVFVRGLKISFSTRMPEKRSLLEKLRHPESGLGVGLKNRLIETFPSLISYTPGRWRIKFVKTYLGPSVAWWLLDRVTNKFPIHYDLVLKSADVIGEKLRVRFRDGKTGEIATVLCDHLIAGTGFEVDIDRLQFLCPDLRCLITQTERSARLDKFFQSSVPGLHFIGAASVMSFGPLFRFVVGARYTSKTLAAYLRRRIVARSASRVIPSSNNPTAKIPFVNQQGPMNDAI
jgi:FAD-dependent urate hydroxylase